MYTHNAEDKMFQTHSLYNLSRYLYLKIENSYSAIIEKSGITLPQLRVLWIIKSFPGISLKDIAQYGCWSPPTVTNILKNLMQKNLVLNKESQNRKQYKLELTSHGEKIIGFNKQNKNDEFILLSLIDAVRDDELNFIIDIFYKITIIAGNSFIFDYIEKVNRLSLKIDFKDFTPLEIETIKKLICFYNLLRTFVLTVENNHSNLLAGLKLTYPQIRALWILEAFPGLTSVELSELGFWSPSTANLIVKNLYSKGLVYKKRGGIKNSLHLYIAESGDKLLIQDFISNQRRLDIHKIVEPVETGDLIKTNQLLLAMNKKLGNNMVESYIKETYKNRAK